MRAYPSDQRTLARYRGPLADDSPGLTTLERAAQAATKTYSSCDKLHKDFEHGVAKSKKAAKKQVADGYGMPAYGDRSKRSIGPTTRPSTATTTAPPARRDGLPLPIAQASGR